MKANINAILLPAIAGRKLRGFLVEKRKAKDFSELEALIKAVLLVKIGIGTSILHIAFFAGLHCLVTPLVAT